MEATSLGKAEAVSEEPVCLAAGDRQTHRVKRIWLGNRHSHKREC